MRNTQRAALRAIGLAGKAGSQNIYARAAARFGDQFYAGVARRTCDYVLRERIAPGGGFCAAQDAEVDGREGLNYLWTPDQVRAARLRGQEKLAGTQ